MTRSLILLVLLLANGTTFAAEDTKPAVDDSSQDTLNRTLVWPDGTRYVGGVKDGKRWGKGTIFWQDGTRFVGSFVNDLRSGPGTMILQDGTVYNGYFENDKLVESATNQVSQAEASAPIAEVSSEQATALAQNAAQTTGARLKSTQNHTDKSQASGSETTTMPGMPGKTLEPAETAVVAKTPAAATEDSNLLTEASRQQIESMIDAWAAAWSAADVKTYLSFYSPDFKVPGKQSRSQWEGLRRSRLSRPASISVQVAYEKFETSTFDASSGPGVAVDFLQTYRSNIYNDKTNKRLIVRKEGTDWKILSEQSR